MKLRDYIKQNYEYSQTAFAKANGFKVQWVNLILKKDCWYIYDGKLMQAKKEVK